MLTRERVQAWLDSDLTPAHLSRRAIGDLFSAGRSTPTTLRPGAAAGSRRDRRDWLAEPDEAGSWEASYRPLLIDGDRAVATGESRYADGKVFSNLYVLRFDEDGRCAEFVEWYMEQPRGQR